MLRDRSADYTYADNEDVDVDWVAGMFMIFPSRIYREVKGFDTRFFMYLEDADICRRLKRAGYRVVCDTRQVVIHDARRSSFKNRQHLKWHMRSMLRFIFGL